MKTLEDWKIKIAVLWIVFACVEIATNILMLFEPGVLEGIMAGELFGMKIGPELLLLSATLLLVPLIMAFLSLMLKDSISRWASIILGIVFAFIALSGPIEYLAKQSAYSAYVMLIGIVGFVATALIVWYAWKSKQKT